MRRTANQTEIEQVLRMSGDRATLRLLEEVARLRCEKANLRAEITRLQVEIARLRTNGSGSES